MPYVLVTGDDGTVHWRERVTPQDFDTEHFQRCLCDRLSWAVQDATEPAPIAHSTIGSTGQAGGRQDRRLVAA
jgi:hypothetical protein